MKIINKKNNRNDEVEIKEELVLKIKINKNHKSIILDDFKLLLEYYIDLIEGKDISRKYSILTSGVILNFYLLVPEDETITINGKKYHIKNIIIKIIKEDGTTEPLDRKLRIYSDNPSDVDGSYTIPNLINNISGWYKNELILLGENPNDEIVYFNNLISYYERPIFINEDKTKIFGRVIANRDFTPFKYENLSDITLEDAENLLFYTYAYEYDPILKCYTGFATTNNDTTVFIGNYCEVNKIKVKYFESPTEFNKISKLGNDSFVGFSDLTKLDRQPKRPNLYRELWNTLKQFEKDVI